MRRIYHQFAMALLQSMMQEHILGRYIRDEIAYDLKASERWTWI